MVHLIKALMACCFPFALDKPFTPLNIDVMFCPIDFDQSHPKCHV